MPPTYATPMFGDARLQRQPDDLMNTTVPHMPSEPAMPPTETPVSPDQALRQGAEEFALRQYIYAEHPKKPPQKEAMPQSATDAGSESSEQRKDRLQKLARSINPPGYGTTLAMNKLPDGVVAGDFARDRMRERLAKQHADLRTDEREELLGIVEEGDEDERRSLDEDEEEWESDEDDDEVLHELPHGQ